MKTLSVKDFDLSKTIESGQFFNWEKAEDGYLLAIKNKAFFIKQKNNKVFFEGKNIEAKDIKEIFGLNENLKEIYKQITKNEKDKILKKAIKEFYGLRIMKQDKFECLISYILSINSNIPRIKSNVRDLAKKFGKEVKINNFTINLFPSFNELKNVSIEKLKGLKFGFRAKYIKQTLTFLKDFDLNLEKYNFEEAKRKLMLLPGVGEKVAECVLLYSFRNYEAFPIDVWIKRIMEKEYLKRKASKKEIRNFAKEYFGKYAGYANIYLFFYARKNLI
ncbi:MAG: DNA-3-methyladenine glycosylase family protein [Candidatus Micrarchaeia archaeon]